jgi:hypothetical protein
MGGGGGQRLGFGVDEPAEATAAAAVVVVVDDRGGASS